jgi:hypothetical protein
VRNLTSGHERDMALLPRAVRFGILCWFTGIVQYYQTHPVYGILFSAGMNGDDPEPDDKIRIGMNEVALFLQKEGYGNPWSMNLNGYFDAQVQSLRDSIRSALASGAKLDEIAQKTGLSGEVIIKLQ